MSFLPGITTPYGNDWRCQISSLDVLKNVHHIALFPTTISNLEEREGFCQMLEERNSWLTCPAVHLRDDMELWEYEEFLALGGRVFNLHATPRALRFVQDNPDIAGTIFVENGYYIDETYWQMLRICGGACVDLAHLEDFGFLQRNAGYDRLIEELPEIEVGMTHIAAVRDEPHQTPCGNGVGTELTYEDHFVGEFPGELKYLRRPEILAVVRRCRWNCIELNNPINDQMIYVEYIKNIISL